MNRLLEIKKKDSLIESKKRELEKLNELMISVKVSDYSKERIQMSHENDSQIIETISKIQNLEREIMSDIQEFVEFKAECMRMIDSLDNPKFIDIAYKRYFEYKSFERIAEEMDLSKVWVLELNKRLLSIVY